VVNIFNPELVVVGGILSLAGPAFYQKVKDEVKQRIQASYRPEAKIISSMNGFDACAVGGVAVVLNEIMQNPSKWNKLRNNRLK
jgi:predicted NBD/HSP70 family sugar kinase